MGAATLRATAPGKQPHLPIAACSVLASIAFLMLTLTTLRSNGIQPLHAVSKFSPTSASDVALLKAHTEPDCPARVTPFPHSFWVSEWLRLDGAGRGAI